MRCIFWILHLSRGNSEKLKTEDFLLHLIEPNLKFVFSERCIFSTEIPRSCRWEISYNRFGMWLNGVHLLNITFFRGNLRRWKLKISGYISFNQVSNLYLSNVTYFQCKFEELKISCYKFEVWFNKMYLLNITYFCLNTKEQKEQLSIKMNWFTDS